MNAYADHLVTVNSVQEVIASVDIYNAQGQILVRKGAELNASMVEKMARFKLQKPIEDSIAIENELNSETVLKRINEILANDRHLNALHEKSYNHTALKACCDTLRNFPILRQKLTVLSLILPEVFEQALFCAWLGSMICNATIERTAFAKNVFLAALCHDIGMVHISADVLNKKDELTLDEWKQIQAHPVIGYNIMKDTQGVEESVAKAILEHHEALDGTGYPRGLIGAKLETDGLLLNLLDSVNAIYRKYFKPHDRSIARLIPIIQLNRQGGHGHNLNQLIVLLRQVGEQEKCSTPPHLTLDVIEFTKTRGNYIIECSDACNDLVTQLGFRHNEPRIHAIQNAVIHITFVIASAGVINEAYLRWLDQVASEKLEYAYVEVEEANLIMREVIYHIKRLKRQIKLYLEKPDKPDFVEQLTAGLQKIEAVALPETPNKLRDLWLFDV